MKLLVSVPRDLDYTTWMNEAISQWVGAAIELYGQDGIMVNWLDWKTSNGHCISIGVDVIVGCESLTINCQMFK